jgi:uncharacterized protein YecA (UPF0149 family)
MAEETTMIPYDPEKDRPKPIEETDPELGEFFKNLVDYQVKCKGEGKLSHFDVDQFIGSVDKGSARNKPCPCGSGKKFKKCCMLD